LDIFGRTGVTPGSWTRRQGRLWTSGGASRSAWVGGAKGASGPKSGKFVTGVAELDAILATMEDKEIRQAVVKATDATIKNYVLPAYRANIEAAGFVETGATRDVAKKRRVKRSRTQFGSELFIDRVKVVALRRERGARIGHDKKRGEDFFHPVAIEFGDESHEPERPLWRALKGNVTAALAEFHKYLREALDAIVARGQATIPKP